MASRRGWAKAAMWTSLVGATGLVGGAAVVSFVPSLTTPVPRPPQTPFYKGLRQRLASDEVPGRAGGIAKLRAAGTAETELDVLVIGGGATGAGTALDAVTRGLSVGVVERDDFACGTSSRSTKLLHGGVRYLEKAVFELDPAQLSLVFEALKERGVLVNQAPHLCSKLPTLVPCYSTFDVLFFWAGMKAYDLLAAAGFGTLAPSRFVSAQEALEAFPTLKPAKEGRALAGGIIYYDGTMNDSRLNVAVALTAAKLGAAVANHCPVEELIVEAEGDARTVRGAIVRDTATNTTFPVRAKVVINCTGPYSDVVKRMVDREVPTGIVPSAGAHLTLPRFYCQALRGEQPALLVPKTSDGRVLFVAPWQGRTIVGTTDRVVDTATDGFEPRATEEDITFILEALQEVSATPVRREDILSVWCGIRPLAVDAEAHRRNGESGQSIVREHLVSGLPGVEGFLSVAGGKWTTFRKMGSDAVDAAIAATPALSHARHAPSLTEHLPLLGAPADVHGAASELGQLLRSAKVTVAPDVEEHLLAAYGSEAAAVVRAALPPRGGPCTPARVSPALPVLEAEVVHAVRQEMCMHVADFVSRRTRMAFLDAAAAHDAVERVAHLMGQELKWDKARLRAEIEAGRRHTEQFLPPAAPEAAKKSGRLWSAM